MASQVDGFRATSNSWLEAYREWLGTLKNAISQGLPTPTSPMLASAIDNAVATAGRDRQDLKGDLRAVNALMIDWREDVHKLLRALVGELAVRDVAVAEQAFVALRDPDPVIALSGATQRVRDLSSLKPPSGRPGAPVLESERTAPATPTEMVLPGAPLTLGLRLSLGVRRSAASTMGLFARFVRWVLLAAVVCIGLWWGLSADWNGTPTQMLALFGWAFAFDVTFAGVTAALGGASTTMPKLTSAGPGEV